MSTTTDISSVTDTHGVHKITTAAVSVDTSVAAAIDRFKAFLRIPTITADGPSGPNQAAVTFLKGFADGLGVSNQIVEFVKGYPLIIMTVAGSEPSLPSILLNSHYDVVPVMREHWNTEPFAAQENDNGDIFARGSQDMKCVCMAYLEALARIVLTGATLKRTLHLCFTPDEETGGHNGANHFVRSPLFRSMNIGCALDEGIASVTADFTVFYGERAVWWTHITARGPTGHGSRFIKDTANAKLIGVVNKLLKFRDEQEALLQGRTAAAYDEGCAHATVHNQIVNNQFSAHEHEHNGTAHPPLQLGDVITVNLTMLRSGVTTNGGESFSINVIPMQAEAGFDIRIPPSVNLADFESLLKEWTHDADNAVSYDFYQKVERHSLTSIDERENPYWKCFTHTIKSLNHNISPQIFPAGTDGRYIREQNIPVFGFSPMAKTPILLHDHNEYINKKVYVEMIDVYEKLIPELCNFIFQQQQQAETNGTH